MVKKDFVIKPHSRIMAVYRNPPFPDVMDKSLLIYSLTRETITTNNPQE